MKSHKEVGEKVEATILNHCIQNDIPVSVPWGNNKRYDLVIEIDSKLLKAQCKKGTYKNGVVAFATASKAGGKKRQSYSGQIDCFLVYCKELNSYYKIDIVNVTNINCMHLRIDPPKNGIQSTINWAKDYTF